MNSITFKFLLCFCVVSAYAEESATQTSWSGGSGVVGPVISWGEQFFQSSAIQYSSNPGNLVVVPQSMELISSSFTSPRSIFPYDIDEDGDIDIVASGYNDDAISWFENSDGLGTSWISHEIGIYFNGANSVFMQDIDNDNDMDVIGSAYQDDEIAWWENVNSGDSWIEHTIDTNYDGPRSVHSQDINLDGYMDVLGCSHSANVVTWWRNSDTTPGVYWTEHEISNSFNGAASVFSQDIDGDGDFDVLGATGVDHEIIWWENEDGTGSFWIEHVVDDYFVGASSVFSDDLDGDGDMDILGTGQCDEIAWWENMDGLGGSWEKHIADPGFINGSCIYAYDMDEDGDKDILAAALDGDGLAWWSNVDGSGTEWMKMEIGAGMGAAFSIFPADLNNDGSMDIVGSGYPNKIGWWDLTASGWLESSILDLLDGAYWGNLDWTSDTSSGSSVSFQLRSSNEYWEMGSWSDTLTEPCSLDSVLTDGDQYVQYRALLERTEPGATLVLEDITITWDQTGIGPGEGSSVIALFPMSPNPTSAPIVRFSLPESASVGLFIYELSGRLIRNIQLEECPVGFQNIQLDRLPNGSYFCRMMSDDFSAVQRFVVIE